LSSTPIELPLKASEVAAVAEVIYQTVNGQPLSDELRSQLAARFAALNTEGMEAHAGSLQSDPAQSSAYYMAVDALSGGKATPLLLHIALASAPASTLFPNLIPIGRMRPGGGREVVVSAIPFSSYDREAVRTYAEQVDRAFLPRPQGALPAIASGNRHPEISLPAVLGAFREILNDSGVNMASTVQLSATREMTTDDVIAARDGENPTAPGHTRVSIRHLYHAGLWAAIRAGWREGYNAEADHIIISGNTPDEIRRSIEAGKEAIRHASGYTKFTTDTSKLFCLEADPRHPAAWDDAVVAQRFESVFPAEEQRWALDAFSKPFAVGDAVYRFSAPEIRRLTVKFGESLKLNEDLYDFIGQARAADGRSSTFDFEPSLDEADTLTTAQELIFCMHWLKERGRAAQLVPPNLGFKKRQAYPEAIETTASSGVGLADYVHHKMWPELLPRVVQEFGSKPLAELAARVAELAAVAQHFNGTLSIHSGSGKQPAVLERIGQSTGGRVNYKISGELQLQLFDVISEQPAGSPWRALFDRMVERCNRFAAAGAFGAESELAAKYVEMGRGSYLGDSARGRVDGNLFLVFWLGNLVGTRDTASPDGDHRFFKEKLDELPGALLSEVRRRNAAYVVWLARHLKG
jgi:hypothetical protein